MRSAHGFTLALALTFTTVLGACDSAGPEPKSEEHGRDKGQHARIAFTKPVIRLPLPDGSGYHLFGIKDCRVYRALQTNDGGGDWTLLFEPEFYLLPTACVRERLEVEGEFLQIEIGTQAIGAGGCCTTYAAYRTKHGSSWEIRPATSIQTWQPLVPDTPR